MQQGDSMNHEHPASASGATVPDSAPPPSPGPLSRPRLLPRLLGFAVIYFLAALLGRVLVVQPGAFVSFWPPSGIFVAALLLNEPRHWPWFVAAGLAANLGFDLWNGQYALISLLFYLGNSLEALTGAGLVRWFLSGGRPDLSRVRDVLGLTVFAALLSPLISATLGAAAVNWLTGGNAFASTWRLWWCSDMLGVLLFAPLVLAWYPAASRVPPTDAPPAQWGKAAAFAAVLCLATAAAMHSELHSGIPLKFVVLPLILAAAFLFGLRGVTLSNVAVALLAVALVSREWEPAAYARVSRDSWLAALALFLSAVALTGLFMAAVLAKRSRNNTTILGHQAELQTIYDHVPMFLCVLDDQRRIVMANRELAAYVGRPAAELITGTACGAFGCIHTLDSPGGCGHGPRCAECALRLALQDTAATGRSHSHIEHVTTVRQGDGSRPAVWLGATARIRTPERTLTLLTLRDVTEERQREHDQLLSASLLEQIHTAGDRQALFRGVTRLLHDWTGCEAAGIRIREGADFPYFFTHGFPPEFVESERSPCSPDSRGEPLRDGTGEPVLDCLCGAVLQGRFEPTHPCATARGNFWTNSTTRLRDTPASLPPRFRNRCGDDGYESVALIAIRAGTTTFGLLQFNDKRPDRFTPATIASLERAADHLALALARHAAEEARLQSEARTREDERNLRTIFDAIPESLMLLARDGTVLAANQTIAARLGTTVPELVNRHVKGFIPADVAARRMGWIEEVMRTGLPLTREDQREDRWIRNSIIPVRDNEGTTSRLVVLGVDITERKRDEAVMAARLRLLKVSQQQSLPELLRSTLDEAEALTGSRIGFYHFLAQDQVTLSLQAWSTNTTQTMCQAKGAGLHYPVAQAGVWVDCLHERRPVIHNDYASLPHRKGLPPGHAPVIRQLVVPVMRGDRITAILGVGNKPTDYTDEDTLAISSLADLAWDLAERKQAESDLRQALAEKELLLKEIHHRVKNNMQIISALLHLQAERLGDPGIGAALRESQNRIKSMAMVHEKLYQSDGVARLDFKTYVQSLTDHLIGSHLLGGRVVRCQLRIGAAHLDLTTAIACGLLVNELVSNALKHAFHKAGPDSANEIVIELTEQGDRWRLAIADNGSGIPGGVDWEHPPALGLWLVQMLARQLKGTVQLEKVAGCRFVVEFPKTSQPGV